MDDVVAAFDKAISQFMARNPSHLTQIDVVIFDQSLLKKFQTGIAQVAAAAPSPLLQNVAGTSVDNDDSNDPKMTSNIFSSESEIHRRYRVVLFITSNNANNISKVSALFHVWLSDYQKMVLPLWLQQFGAVACIVGVTVKDIAYRAGHIRFDVANGFTPLQYFFGFVLPRRYAADIAPTPCSTLGRNTTIVMKI